MTTDARHPIVIKIGGSTLGADDTTIEDVVALQRAGERVIVVHGGGAMITDWLTRMEIPSVFVDGLRSTSAAALDVVVGVLRGVVNTQLVGAFVAAGAPAVGMSGVDGGLVQAERYDDRLEYVGRITGVRAAILQPLLDGGVIPVIAPIGVEPPAQPLNINADTVAGEVARAVGARLLVFLTDVDGLLDRQGTVIPTLSAPHAEALRVEGVLSGGMIPKIEACFRAAAAGADARIANGRQRETLRRLAAGEQLGTRIGA